MDNRELVRCGRCFLPIHPDDTKQYMGTCTTHDPNRCVQLLRAALESAEKDAARYRDELENIKEVEFPRRVEVVSKNWRIKVDRAAKALMQISLTSKGYPNGSLEGEAARGALQDLGYMFDGNEWLRATNEN